MWSRCYYAEERDGLSTHPLADMFFVTEGSELVLVDFTGGNEKRLTTY